MPSSQECKTVADFYKIKVADVYSKKANTGFDDMDDDIPFSLPPPTTNK
jgi:hypothetical protein